MKGDIRTDEVGRRPRAEKNGGKYRRSRFPFANTETKDDFILPTQQ